MIPKANDPVPLGFEPAGANQVFCFALSMLPAIDLNDDSRLVAEEIHDEFADRDLATNASPEESVGSQVVPEPHLRIRHAPTEAARRGERPVASKHCEAGESRGHGSIMHPELSR